MNQLVRISKILSVEPFKITVIWNNGEIRINDFMKLFEQWKVSKNTHLLGLSDWEVFKNVSVSHEPSRTLEWVNYPITFTFKGKTQTAPTDLDPDVLYQESTFVRTIDSIPIGVILKQAREKAGLTQADVAANAGTTRHYISRIENGKSDIQIETLHKIVELGLGKELRLEVV
jgi:DNA-binding XRE family transcriptional regulator